MSTTFNPYWLEPGAAVPVDIATTAALVTEIKRLRQALAQPKKEPVGWLNANEGVDAYAFTWRKKETHDIPLYTAPPSIEAAVLAERAACEKACEEFYTIEGIAQKCAAAIRARSKHD